MATPESPGGLLSRVAQFVRNPNTGWADAGKPDATTADVDTPLAPQASRDAFRQMLERKQYNDAVRRREFDKLRQMRRQAAARAAGTPLTEAKPTAMVDSELPDDDEERAETIRKIDDIEAQMSHQWWKARNAASDAQSPAAPAPEPTLGPVALARAAVEVGSRFATTLASDLPTSADPDETPTLMGTVTPTEAAPAASCASTDWLREPVRMAEPHAAPPAAGANPASAPDDALEEAAIRFATGDDGGAEESLLAALRRTSPGLAQVQTWAQALFELYSATDQRDRYEPLAQSVAQRYGLKVLPWAALQGLLSATAPAQPEPAQPTCGVAPAVAPETLPTAQPGRTADDAPWVWRCPARLDGPVLVELRQRLAQTGGHAVLDWQALQHITDAAGQTLAAWVARWCDAAPGVRFTGESALDAVLATHTVLGDAQVPRWWWQLRLDCLRLTYRQTDFDQVALDFCVTYEVSPPTWQPPRSATPSESLSQAAQHAAPSDAPSPAALSDFRIELPPPAGLRLSGALVGDISPKLGPLQHAARQPGPLTVSCAGLQRVDFSAAGGLLAWAAQAQAQGCAVQLCDVGLLVATFFRVVGIHEHASVVPRTIF
ncbi:MAG: hypothetical protein Fur007_02910 [Rhodoferax sp.]